MLLTIYAGPGRHGEHTRRAAEHMLAELGVPGEVKLTHDELDCTCAGVLVTPALSIDGQLVAQGWLPGAQELRHHLEYCVRQH